MDKINALRVIGVVMSRDYMLVEDWQGAEVFDADGPALFVYWPFAGTA